VVVVVVVVVVAFFSCSTEACENLFC
jgi:hypothetical protein